MPAAPRIPLTVPVPVSGRNATTADPWVRLPTLTDSNYRRWSSSVRTYLRAKRLWSIVSGEVKVQHATDTDEWWVKNAAAASILIASVDDDQLELIADLELASDQWETLYKVHELPHKPPVLSILQYFFTFTAGGMSVDEAATELTRVQSDIRRFYPTDTPSDLIKAIVLMNGVDRSFDDTNSAILNEQNITYETCVSRLRDAETSKKAAKPESAKRPQARAQNGEQSAAGIASGQQASVEEPNGSAGPSQTRVNPLAQPFEPSVETREASKEGSESVEQTSEEKAESASSDNKGIEFGRFQSPLRGAGESQNLEFGHLGSPTPNGMSSLERTASSLDCASPSNAWREVAGPSRSVVSTNGGRSPADKRPATDNGTRYTQPSTNNVNSPFRFRKGRDPCSRCGKRSHSPENCWFKDKDKGDGRRLSSKKNQGRGGAAAAAAAVAATKGWHGSESTSRTGRRRENGSAGDAGSDDSVDTVSHGKGWPKRPAVEQRIGDEGEEDAAPGPKPRPDEAELISW